MCSVSLIQSGDPQGCYLWFAAACGEQLFIARRELRLGAFGKLPNAGSWQPALPRNKRALSILIVHFVVNLVVAAARETRWLFTGFLPRSPGFATQTRRGISPS